MSAMCGEQASCSEGLSSTEASAMRHDRYFSRGTFSQHAAGRGRTFQRLPRPASDSHLCAAELSASSSDREFGFGTFGSLQVSGRAQLSQPDTTCSAEASAARHTQHFARGTFSQHATGWEHEHARDQGRADRAAKAAAARQLQQLAAANRHSDSGIQSIAEDTAPALQGIRSLHAVAEQHEQQQGPACFVITHSVAKRHNVGTIARCATAFGVKQLCLVGARQFNTFGSHGSDAYVDFGHYNTLEQCVQHLKTVECCTIVGVEIVDGAKPVHMHPFTGPTAFMLGNEGQGLSPKQMALCDSFVYIPQHGSGTASLNVAIACSIVLHHFAIWAEYSERERNGCKFVVAPRQQRTRPRGIAGDPEEVRRERAARRQAVEPGADLDLAGLGLEDWQEIHDGQPGIKVSA